MQAELAGEQSALAEQRSVGVRLEQEIAEIQASQQSAQARLQAEREQEAARLQSELAATRQAHDEDRRAWLAAHEEQQQALEEQRRAWEAELAAAQDSQQAAQASALEDAARKETELAQIEQELELEREALADERSCWMEQQDRQQAELAEQRERLEQERAELQAERSREEYQPGEGERQDEAPAAEHNSGLGVTGDLLRRFGIASPDDEAAESETAQHADARGAGDGDETASRSAPREEQEEDSIDDYMARLLERLGAKGVSQRPSELEPSRRPAKSASREPKREEAAPEPPKLLRDPSEMTPRAVAAESSRDLSAMRELAILNARAAIDLHERQTLLQRFFSKAFTSFVAVVAAALLFWFYVQGNEASLPLAVLALAAAVAWAWQYLALRRAAAPRSMAGKHADGRQSSAR